MFRLLHRIVVVGFWVLLVLIGWFAYEHRTRIQPVLDEIEILKHLQLTTDPSRVIARMTGEVYQITGPDSFRLRTADGVRYHLRLEAAQAPPESTPAARRWREQGARRLSHWLLSNRVEVDLVYTNEYRLGLGFAFRAGTNVNVQLVKSGLARINPDQLKNLPLREQFALLSAQQEAQTARLGMWK
ncbi:MAG: thermonuclease family protein [Verrucomicrobia bacterium]|nr:thermonuclease family protein [Verrucomicrobiota bacterium]